MPSDQQLIGYRFHTLLAGLSLILCAACASVERTVPNATDALAPGLTHQYFSDWSGPRLSVWVYRPHDVDPTTAPILIMMHGAKRGAARYLSEWDQIADQFGFIIVAPEFAKKDFPGSAHYNLGNLYERGTNTANPEPVWTFSAIEPIFYAVRQQLGSQQSGYTLYGHSAGSQFVHRFMALKPDNRAKRFLLANAGWYTLPTLNVDWPYGFGNMDMDENRLRAILESDVVVLLGDQDDDSAHASLRRTPEATQQGPHRFARGQHYFALAKRQAQQLGVEFGWQKRIVEGVAHSNGGIAAASGDLIK